jgi:fimbrial isopeptide formation D2 family protein/uncharacterized repeat protein (TIGR01451 family)
MLNKLSKTSFWKTNRFALGAIAFVAVLAFGVGIFSNYVTNQKPTQQASAATEPVCQNVATNPTWNPYPINTTSPNPIFPPSNCQDIPLLSFFPVNTGAGNPREKNLLSSQSFSIQAYYNNGAVPTAGKIQDPRLKVQFAKVSDTRYKISATLSGSNSGTATSAQKGGDLFVNVPVGAKFDIVKDSTYHWPDRIERDEETQSNGRRPNDLIADNVSGTNVSNKIYSSFEGKTLSSTDGFQIKSDGLEAGFLGYGYVLTQLSVNTNPIAANNPPSIPGEEITVVRGQTATFTKTTTPTDPDGDYPVSLNLSNVPSNCSVTGATNSQGGGQTVACTTGQNTPSRFTFIITPTDSRGLVGNPGTWIVNIIDPDLRAEKKCFVKGTDKECKEAPLQAGDQITYKITATNKSVAPANKVKIVDDYDESKIENIVNISNGGIKDSFVYTQAVGSNPVNNGGPLNVIWNDLGTLEKDKSITVSYDATIKSTVQLSDKVINIALVSAENIPAKEVKAEFTIGGDLNLLKKCFVKGTTTPCNEGKLSAGKEVTYQIEVSNSTKSEIKNVILTDTYEKDKLTNVTAIEPDGTLNTSAGNIVWNLGNMTTASKKTVKFNATIASTVAAGTNIKNIAIVKADGVPEKKSEVEFITIGPKLTSEKLCFRKGTSTPCSTAKMLPNENVTYIVRTTNNGTVDVENVTITDTFDGNRLTNITGIDPQGALAGNVITWNLGTLIVDRTAEVRFDATIKSDVPSGTTVVNTAIIRGKDVPDQTVKAEFPIQIIIIETPRTGGGMALILVALIAAAGAGGYYYYKKNSKFSEAFVPGRKSEDKTNTTVSNSENHSHAHHSAHKSHMRAAPKRKS